MRRSVPVAFVVWLLTVFVAAAPQVVPPPSGARAAHASGLFQTSDSCIACHNGLTDTTGEDVSIGADWRGSMMANSSRDPYWQASVRREILDHPAARDDIEDECSICHMPMARTAAQATGRKGEIFAYLPVSATAAAADRLAHDGVSCTICHQITSEKLGSPESFTGGYVIDLVAAEPRPLFGPFEIDKGRTTIMRSSTGFRPTESAHVQQSELCATCHTLYTTALGPQGEAIGRLPEQMPYLEWRHSDYAVSQSCQACRMPVVEQDTPIASVLGEPRKLARHTFRGGNFFMQRLLNRYRGELGVEALSQELDRSANRTVQHLQTETATVAIDRVERSGDRLAVEIAVTNRAGHKLPTGYPARRVWLHVTARDAGGSIVFESGGLNASGLIDGNDNDLALQRVEPHYEEITGPDQVQIYESVMADVAGLPTTGLLQAVRYLKDNRLLPRGFDKSTAEADIAVVGLAREDADFIGGQDRIRYAMDVKDRSGPITIDVELRFQPIAYRWAQNLKQYDAAETRRFVSYYDSLSHASSEVLARTASSTR